MRVIPVIDLMNGQVVRGVAGRRAEYRPIESMIAKDARPGTVARALVEGFGFETCYVADIDSIQGRPPNLEAWEAISRAGLKLWIDAGMCAKGLSATLHAQQSNLPIDANVVLGLESLTDPSLVIDSLAFLGPSRIVFSLDLHHAQPLTSIESWQSASPIEIAHWVVNAGIGRVIVLDLADVGVGGGTGTVELCREVRRDFPSIELIAGGGVRGLGDLEILAGAGCDGALVASALHDGRLTREEIRRVENLAR